MNRGPLFPRIDDDAMARVHDIRYSTILAVFGILFASACEEPTITEKEAETYVSNWAERAEETLADQVPVAGVDERFEKLAGEAGDAAEEDSTRSKPPYDLFIRDVYSNLDWKTPLVDSNGLSDRGETVWSVVSNLDRHALSDEDFDLKRVQSLLEKIRELNAEMEEISGYEPTERELQSARKWLQTKKKSEFELDPENYDRVVEAVMEGNPDGELVERMDKIDDFYIERANALAQLEHSLARETVRYSRKMKHFRVRHVFIHEREDDYWRLPQTEGERPDEAKGPYLAGTIRRSAAKVADEMKDEVAILHRRMKETLEAVLTDDDPARVLKDLEPAHPQYAKLKSEYERYRKIVENGGWSEVPRDPYLDPGDRDENVKKLKKRLQIEGYYPDDAPIDQTYGDTLVDAIETYQKTHQLQVTGEPHDVFWSSLNKSAERRMRQIAINLGRWRESDLRHSDPMYVLINIPGFNAEVWKNQQRAMRFRIVVGNDKSDFDEENHETVRPNRTPELSAYIDRVIYNPYWNVTDRIRATEILPEVRQSLENKYKAKLREMRREKRGGTGMGGGLASDDGGDSAEQSESEPTTADMFGLGLGTSGNSEGDTQESGEDESEAEENTTASASSSENDESSEEESADEDSPDGPSVPIDDLYRMVDVEDDMSVVDKKAIFDVEKIRALIADTSSGQPKSGSERAEAAPSGSAGPESGEAGGQDGGTSALQKTFPYLDPETGVVDVSSTDPDHIPTWYEENDYEVVFPGKEWEYVRMKQGDQNALGRVKVIFPNKHAVYLHDTPKKHLFEKTIRAYSHGCMRMQDPLDFAEYLLKQDGKFGDIDVDSILNEKKRVRAENDPDKEWKKSYEYRPVFLDREIPVHIDYLTVEVGENGRAHFYADIYDKDEKLLKDEG